MSCARVVCPGAFGPSLGALALPTCASWSWWRAMDHTLADVLNRSCDCVSTDMDALSRLLGESMPAGWAESLVASS